MANTEIIDDLVSDKALSDLKGLNEELVKSYEAMEELLNKAQALTTEFDRNGKSVSELKGVVDASLKVETEKNALIKKETDLLAQKDKAERENLKTEVQRQKAAQETLKTEVQQERVTRENIKTKQAEAKASEQQARAGKKADDAMKSQTGSINKMRGLLAGLVIEYNRADEATRKKLAPAIRELQERINSANAAIGRHQGYVGNYQRALMGLGKQLLGAFGVVGGLSMLVGAFKSGVSAIVKFEQANVNLASILGTNVKNISALTESAKMLGNTTEWAASQVTELQTELAKLGFTESQIMSMQASVLQFATAMDTGLAPAAELAGSVLRAFGMLSYETERAVSVMAVGANKSALSFEYLNTAMSTVSPVARAFGFTIEDTVALLGTLSNAGFNASTAATATRNILLNLADANGKLAKELGKPVRTIPELASALKELKERGVSLNDTLELTDQRSVAAFNSFLDGTDILLELREALEDVNGELERMQKDRLQTVEGSAKLLSSAWESLKLTFSSSTGPMSMVVDGLTAIVNWANRALQSTRQLGDAGIIEKITEAGKSGKKTGEDETKLLKSDAELLRLDSRDYLKEEISEEEALEKARAQRLAILNRQEKELAEKIKKAREEYEKASKNVVDTNMPGIAGLFMKPLNDAIYSSARKNVLVIADMIGDIEAEMAGVQIRKEAVINYEGETTAGSGLGLNDEKKQKEAERAAEKARRAEEKRVKQLAEDIKSLGLIEMFRFETVAEVNKGIVDDDKKTWEERREAANAYIQAEIDAVNSEAKAKLDAVEEELKSEIISETTAANQIDLIREKAAYEVTKLEEKKVKEIRKLNEKEADQAFKAIQGEIGKREAEMDAAMQKELVERARQYEEEIKLHVNSEQQRKKITEKYAKDRAEIVRKHSMDALNFEIGQLEAALEITNLTEEEKADILEKINKLREKSVKEMADYEVNQTEDKIEKMLTAEQKLKKFLEDERTQAVMKTWDVMLETMNMYYDNELKRIDELEKREKEHDEEKLRMLDENVEAGTMSEEEADARKREIEAAALLREKEAEKQRKEMQRKQAIWQKSNAMIQAAINTALAVTSAISTPPAPLGIALAAIVGAMGAAQIAMIAAQTVPSYKGGTEGHAGGPAIVGDGGRPEMVILPSGEVWKTPATDTLAFLPKGTEVLPDFRRAMVERFSMPRMPVYDDGRCDPVFSHDDVLRRNTGEANRQLSGINRGVNAMRANSLYAGRKAELLYRMAKVSRRGGF
jgi:TP901 family phage tail tape measure protein